MSICLSCDLSPLSEKVRVQPWPWQRKHPNQSVGHDLRGPRTRNCLQLSKKRTDGIVRKTVLFDQDEPKQTLHAWLTDSRRRCDGNDRTPITPNGQTSQRDSVTTQVIAQGFEEVSASRCYRCPLVTREPPLTALLERHRWMMH